MFPEKEIEESFDYCEKLAKEHYENFPVGSLLIPKDKRKYVHSVYAFARTADDIADSASLSGEEKLAGLNLLDSELGKIYEGNTGGITESNLIFLKSLYLTKEDLKIPEKEFKDLLTAFKQDSVKSRYDTFDELIEYSSYSANPIGHLVLYIFGYNREKNESLFRYSDKICTALQLTNFWQDVSRDLGIDRVYIPAEIMNKYGYSYEELFTKVENEAFRKVIKELTDRTRLIFEEGKELIKNLSGRLKYEIKATYAGGNEILNKIEGINYGVLSERVKLGKPDKAKILFRTAF